MTSKELYVKNARVWIPNSEFVWEGAVLEEDFKSQDTVINVITEKGEKRQIKITNEKDLPHLRNPAILIGQNDLTALSYLHEPDVLYNLEIRFRDRQLIYTYCGIVLVAINPYYDLPLYGPDIIQAYRGHAMGELEPHIFAVSEEAYAKLEREKSDISIIVSGESGAGKTVSAKYAMRYFAAVGGSESETQIERKVLASSPIMEAIGNAKTTRNDNSSRFGKFTKLLFNNESSVMSLTGASMQTYLLEKSRVVFQAAGERNYHIFYQLCAGREKYPEFMLDHQDKFRFLNQGKSPNIARVSDAEQFLETIHALTTLGFDNEEIDSLMRILAGILHLGNVNITHRSKHDREEVDQETCTIASNDLSLSVMSDILKLDKKNLIQWLTTRQIESFNENVLIPMNKTSAEAARDALAKHLYSKVFHFITNTVNRNLISGQKADCFIGVLDIYGFETFEINSFEQFCINYANEKLQQQFNQHVFKLEQEEYLKEGIVWTMIDFYDNQPCIDLIEAKLGILDLLDEECRVPNGSDQSWVGKLIDKCSKYKHFDKPRFGTSAFLVKHFSDTVQYECHGFTEKNRDTVSKELVSVLQESDMDFCRKLILLDDKMDFDKEKQPSTPSTGVKVVISAAKLQSSQDSKKRTIPSKQHKQTVGSQFRDSLAQLIATLHSTTPHYVRCIKPNDVKQAFKWEATKIVQQLRACGVLETVRISASGFPSRWTYDDFYARYRLLCKRVEIVDWNVKATCLNIVRNWLKDEDKYRFGHTQIFFRAGQVAYLEQLRTDLRKKHIILVQSMIRRFIYRSKYLRLKRTALGLQQYSRGLLARRRVSDLRRNQAAIQIQRYMKGWYYRTKYADAKRSILGIQRYGRGMMARKRYAVDLDNFKAITIQRFCRGYLARKAYNAKIRNVVLVQACVRRFLAKRQFKKMKAEARSFGNLEMRYKGLENKIIELQQKYDVINKENGLLKVQIAIIPDLKGKVDVLKNTENELKSVKMQLSEREDRLIAVQKSLDRERDEKMSFIDDKNKEEEEFTLEKSHWQVERMELKKQVEEMVTQTNTDKKSKLSEIETNEINQAYHKVIKDKEGLESENILLKQEIKRLQLIIANPHEIDSNFNSSVPIDEDFGYSSSRNTLEKPHTKHSTSVTSSQLSEGDILSIIASEISIKNSSHIQNSKTEVPIVPSTIERYFKRVFSQRGDQATSTPNNSPVLQHDTTVLMLRLRKLLEEEKNRGESLKNENRRLKKKSSASFNNEDSIKTSELEVENEKLRQDYQLLRNSIDRGVEQQELEAQYNSVVDELRRRRDECIQLRTILSQQSQSIRSLEVASESGKNDGASIRSYDGTELMDAFQAQKLANRQLESELTALTEEHNMKLTEMSREIDNLRNEKCMIESIIQDKLEINTNNVEDTQDPTLMRQKESYLRMEIEKSAASFVESQERLGDSQKKVVELTKRINILAARLRENGLNDSIMMNDAMASNDITNVVKKKSGNYQGILKHHKADEAKILQRLVTDLTARTAITLLPSLPAYLLFMCIRYTDLLNADDQVKTLLSNFIITVKKLYKVPNKVETRILWVVNSITLHNLLKQYGGNEEYMQFNTEAQNQQQLKNFDLSEYRQVLHEAIIFMYETLVKQLQENIRTLIVPAILYHDETATGKSNRGKAKATRNSPEHDNKPASVPQTLVNQLEHFYKQFMFFGLNSCYIEQIFMQLFYYICANALNNLMLRQDLCSWKTGMKIRFNVSCLENWVKGKKMSENVIKPSIPLNQASLLMQSRKSDDDVDSIYELCPSLTSAQVLKLIKSYSADDCEERISPNFIEKLTQKLTSAGSVNEQQTTFTMDENYIHPLSVVFMYADIKLEDIEVPEPLNLSTLVNKI